MILVKGDFPRYTSTKTQNVLNRLIANIVDFKINYDQIVEIKKREVCTIFWYSCVVSEISNNPMIVYNSSCFTSVHVSIVAHMASYI